MTTTAATTTENPTIGTIYGYCRVSTSQQTTENQRIAIEGRYNVQDCFNDEGVSGTVPALKREGFKDMLSLLNKGDTVVMTAIDRLSRSTRDCLETVDYLNERGINIVFLREGVDTTTAAGKMILTVMAALATMERQNLIERTKQGMERARLEGKQIGRPAVHAHLYPQIDDMSAKGFSIAQIAARLGVGSATVGRRRREKRLEDEAAAKALAATEQQEV